MCFLFWLFEYKTIILTDIWLGEGVEMPAVQETRVWFLGWEDPLEKEMATYSSVLACEISWIGEPDGLQSVESQKSQTQLID